MLCLKTPPPLQRNYRDECGAVMHIFVHPSWLGHSDLLQGPPLVGRPATVSLIMLLPAERTLRQEC